MRSRVGWQNVAFEDLTPPDAPIVYGILQPGPDRKNGVPYVRPTEIGEHSIKLSDLRRTSAEIARRYWRSMLRSKDVILTIVGTIGKVAVVPAELGGGNITQSSCRIRPTPQLVEPEFLAYFLRSDAAISQFGAKKLGTAVLRLNIGDIRRFRIPLAPLTEQRCIVAKLDVLTTRLARARAELDRLPTLADRLRNASLSAVFNEQHHQLVRLGDLIGDLRAGKNLKCDERPPTRHERGVVKVSAVSSGTFRASEAKTLPTSYSPPARDLIENGDLLIARASGSLGLVGRVALVNEDPVNLYLSDKVLRLIVIDKLTQWVYWFLRSPLGRRQIEDAASGISMHNITQSSLRSIRIPLPDESDRLVALQSLEAAFARADHLEAEATRARALLDRLEAALLTKAFLGELVPQDPNDEPASVLLERIRAQRAAAPIPKKTRRAGNDRRAD